MKFLHQNNGRALIADEPGLGKTLQTLTYMKESNSFPAIIVCPASVKGAWEGEAKQWIKEKVFFLEGKKPSHIPPKTRIVVVNYDILFGQLPSLLKFPAKVVVFDEAHELADTTTKKTKAALSLSRYVTKVIGLSGTPIKNRPADFWPILHMVRPKEFPSFNKFAWKYCGPKKSPWGWDFRGASNLDILFKEIKPFTIRRKKDILGLPDRKWSIVPVDLTDRDEYDEAQADFIKWLERKGEYAKADRARGAQQLLRVGYLFRLTSKLKARGIVMWTRDYIAKYPDKKIIMYCVHDNMADVLCRRIVPENQWLRIDGSTPAKRRTELVAQFQKDKDIKLMVCKSKSAGTGITLTAAETTIFAELPWTSSALDQASCRNYRIGQKKDTEVYIIVGSHTMDQRMCELIQSKQGYMDTVIDGAPENTMPLLDMYVQELKGKGK